MSSISNISGSSNLFYMQPVSYGVQSNARDSNGDPQAPSSAELTQAVRQVNNVFRQSNQSIYAAIDKDSSSGLAVVKFIDQNTREIINQFPSKVIVAVARSLLQPSDSRGQLINTSA